MKTSIRNKKGFTIVELVIVIAVIAILAAVLIPTFVSLVNKANVSADMQLVHNLNTALTIDKTENGKHDTMHDAVHALDDYGYDVTKLYKTISEGNMLLWDSVNDVFCLYNGTDECISYYPDGVENKPAVTEMYKYFAVYETVPETQTYSIYYIGTGKTGEGEEEKNDTVKVEVGFDAGHTQINVTYSGTADVAIRMYGGTLTVSSGKVTVYGFVGNISGNTENYTLDDSALVHGDDCHLFGEDVNEPKCLVEDCGQTNPEHTCTVGEIKHVKGEGENATCKIVVYCAICGKEMYTSDCTCGGNGDHNTGNENCTHEWGEETFKEATCSKEGVKYKVCTKCGAIETVGTIPALGHDYETKDGKDATCTEPGYTSYKVCRRENCGHVSGKKTIAATGHQYNESDYKHDNDNHWYVCEACKKEVCNKKTLGKEAHTFSNKIGEDGKLTCKCGYAKNAADENAALKWIIDANKKLDGKNETMYDALCAVAGVTDKTNLSGNYAKIDKIVKEIYEAENGYQIVWDQTIDKFVIAQQSALTPNSTYTIVIYTYEGGTGANGSKLYHSSGSANLWRIYDTSSLSTDSKNGKLLYGHEYYQVYSIYFADQTFDGKTLGSTSAEIKLNVGFDMGCCTTVKGKDEQNNGICISIKQSHLTVRTTFTDKDDINNRIQLETKCALYHYGYIPRLQFGSGDNCNFSCDYYECRKDDESGVGAVRYFEIKEGQHFNYHTYRSGTTLKDLGITTWGSVAKTCTVTIINEK